MFDSAAELLEKIRLGEDSFLEPKEVRFTGQRVTGPRQDALTDDLADELAAFANGRGGVCVLGVDDAREVIGVPLEKLDVLEAFVQQLCQDCINPPLAPVIERLNLPSSTGEALPVLKLHVAGSLFVHKSPGGYFHRVGSSKREMAPDFLARLFQQRSQARIIRFDEQFVPAAVLDDLDEALVNAVAHRDYSIDGAKIRLRMFADRLELYSPGAIPNTMTVDSLPYRQAARNEALTSLLAKCPVSESEHAFTGRSALMDKRGEGVQIILDNSERLSGNRPVYSLLDESELRLVIPALQA